jgi:hypothetical protein
MWVDQDGCCAICGRPESALEEPLEIDHDEKTGVVRGLLCGRCNRAIGLFDHMPELVDWAAKYLRERNPPDPEMERALDELRVEGVIGPER